MVWFVLRIGVDNIVVKTHILPVIAHLAMWRSFEIDQRQRKYLGSYSYAYRSADARDVLPTDHGGSYYPDSKPRAREGVEAVKLFDVKQTFDEKDGVVRTMLRRSAQRCARQAISSEKWGKS